MKNKVGDIVIVEYKVDIISETTIVEIIGLTTHCDADYEWNGDKTIHDMIIVLWEGDHKTRGWTVTEEDLESDSIDSKFLGKKAQTIFTSQIRKPSSEHLWHCNTN